MFRVGTALTSGVSNVVCWARIHHKTKLQGGPHDQSDEKFFANCNLELDQLGVPPSIGTRNHLNQRCTTPTLIKEAS